MSVVLLLLLAFQTADPVTDGVKALDAQDFPQAIKLLSQAVEKDPQDVYAQFNLALAYGASHQDVQAIEGYRKTLTLKPKLYEAELNLGILLIRNQSPKDAVAVLEDAQAQKPKEFRPTYFLAEAYSASGQFDKAESSYKAALDIDPKSATCEHGLAQSIAQQGRLDDAAPHYRKAAELDPRYADAPVELAALYEEHHQPAKAIDLYKQFPQSPRAQERLGALLLVQNQAEDAIAPLEFAVAKVPTPVNRAALVDAYVKSKHPEKALPFVEQLISASPRDAELYMLRGRIYRDQHNFKEAARSFNAAANLSPTSTEAWNELAGMLISLEDYTQALAVFDHLREMKAEIPPHYFFRAIILDKMKQQKPAVEAYKRFLELADGKYPDQEFQARQRVRIIERELNKR